MAKPNYTIVPASNSTNFLPVIISATTSGSPTLIHTSHATSIDEVWLSGYNYSETDVILNILLGGAGTGQILSQVIPALSGLIPILAGQTFTGSVAVSAYSSVSNAISVLARVNRIVFT